MQPHKTNAYKRAAAGGTRPAMPLPCAGKAPSPWSRGRVLVMDDDPAVRAVAALMLNALGYAVYGAEDGEDAVECYRRARVCGFPFRAVILNLDIPFGMGGREAARSLCTIDPQVRAIAMSGDGTDPAIRDFWKYGFSGFLTKPFTLDELDQALAFSGEGGAGRPGRS